MGISTIPAETLWDGRGGRETDGGAHFADSARHEIAPVSVQSPVVAEANKSFVISFGMRYGSSSRYCSSSWEGARVLDRLLLVVTIVSSFFFLKLLDVTVERIWLGALIIALGMLVDNAIVIVEGMQTKIQAGTKPGMPLPTPPPTAMPFLGATLIAILAFAAIGTSQDATGEFCRSLFQVVLVSLLFSWFTAVTVTPLLGIIFLKPPAGDPGADPYATPFYKRFKGLLKGCIRYRWVTVVVVLVLFAGSMWGFKFIDRSFFPSATRPQFTGRHVVAVGHRHQRDRCQSRGGRKPHPGTRRRHPRDLADRSGRAALSPDLHAGKAE